MKILIYAHMLPPSICGMQYQNLQIIQGLYSLGRDIQVIACDNKGVRAFIKKFEFPVYLIPKWPFATLSSTSGISLLNWLFIPYYITIIKKILKRNSPDVVLIADETANFFWGFVAKQCKIPYVSYCSVPLLALKPKISRAKFIGRIKDLFFAMLQSRLRISYENSQLILAVSHSTQNLLITEIPEIKKKSYIVPNSIDDIFFDKEYQFRKVLLVKESFCISEQHFVLLSVTRLTYDKGVDDVLKALAGLCPHDRSRFKYVIVGKGPASRYLMDLSSSLNLDRIAIFEGEVPHIELIPYYDMCDLFVLPPRRGPSESFGRVFVEAAARSKPSIAAMEGGMVDVVDDHSTGILVPPGNIDILREKLMYLSDNPGVLKQLGENAKAKAKKNYTLTTVALHFEKYLRRAIDS